MVKDLLISGKVGNIEYNANKKIREDILKRWDNMQLLEGLEGHVKESVALLYENQAKHLIYEATAADNSGSFETVVFPLIRRIFSRLLANDIVSVQAMTLPIGKMFYFKPVTSEREWYVQDATTMTDGDYGRHTGLMGYSREKRVNSTGNGDFENRYYLPDEVVNSENAGKYNYEGNTSTALYDTYVQAQAAANGARVYQIPDITQYMKKSLYDLFYNDFLYDNSKGKATVKVGSTTPVTLNALGATVAMTTVETNPKTGAVDHMMLEVTGFSNVNAGKLTGPDGNVMDTESFLASLKVVSNTAINDSGSKGYATFAKGENMTYRVVTQKYGNPIVNYASPCDADGKILIDVDLTKPATGTTRTDNGYIGVDPTAAQAIIDQLVGTSTAEDAFKVAWVEYSSLELETEIGEVSFQLTEVVVSVEERKLRATWSPELAQDVSAFHSIDAEAELTAILSEQVAGEIDREILRDIRHGSPWTARWDYYGWQYIQTAATAYTQKDWNQTLMTKINQISAQIQKSSLKGGANWIVASSEIGAVLNDLEYFHVTDASAEQQQYNMGIERIGSLQGRYQVIIDPYAPHNSLIMGHHGTSLLDTGYIYAPYIPMALTPTMYNPFNAAPIKYIATRYAKKLVNNRYFGAIWVDNLVHFNLNELR